MSKHHNELEIQFDLLVGIQKELKQSFEVVQSNWQNRKECSCLTEIDRWEQEVLNRIRQVATKARTMANEMMTKNMLDIRRRLDQLAFDIEQRQEEGNYLDNDITEVKKQLEQLNNNIKHIDEKIRINHTATNKVDWDSLIYVTSERKPLENRFNLPELQYEQEDHQENLWTNFRRLIKNKQSTFKRNSTSTFEPITLTSFDSSTCSQLQRNTYSNATTSENFQSNSFSNDESLKYKNCVSIGYDQQLPQASDA